MGVLGGLGDVYKMQKQARMMQKKLREQKIIGESKGGRVKLFMNAAQEMEDVYVDPNWVENASAKDVEKAIKEAFKDFLKKLQKEMMKSFDMDSLKNMLGGS